MKHSVVWFEVMGENGESLRSFYGRLFDWKIAPTADTFEDEPGRRLRDYLRQIGDYAERLLDD